MSLGLKVKRPDAPVEAQMWNLFKLYESYLSINKEISFPSLLGHDRQKFLCLDAGIVEDSQSSHAFSYKGMAEKQGADKFSFNAEFTEWEKALIDEKG